ncbi:c-di-GMP-binding flagellar brake protein YcgR [Chitinivorax tropicus]|uniref:C-di-GMP-binding flagellar brake protein YcgR n=1 Tax=Chitinivorax tropicus TaxID=714531 RepID=A0A840ME05_9PROT|nr:PilZ domain-containing protein [Chitinivorax tropicus]MBB5017524.1 c-di-GMP-binding flagellar brake protein YcgR [Chitinivorax tropicus]
MSEQRQHPRTQVHLRAALFQAGSREPIKGQTVEISVSGAGILTDIALRSGQQYRMILEIFNVSAGEKQYIETMIDVIHCSLVGNISQFRCGVKYVQPSADFKAKIGKLIRS